MNGSGVALRGQASIAADCSAARHESCRSGSDDAPQGRVATKTLPPEEPSGAFEPVLFVVCLVLLLLALYVTFLR